MNVSLKLGVKVNQTTQYIYNLLFSWTVILEVTATQLEKWEYILKNRGLNLELKSVDSKEPGVIKFGNKHMELARYSSGSILKQHEILTIAFDRRDMDFLFSIESILFCLGARQHYVFQPICFGMASEINYEESVGIILDCLLKITKTLDKQDMVITIKSANKQNSLFGHTFSVQLMKQTLTICIGKISIPGELKEMIYCGVYGHKKANDLCTYSLLKGLVKLLPSWGWDDRSTGMDKHLIGNVNAKLT